MGLNLSFLKPTHWNDSIRPLTATRGKCVPSLNIQQYLDTSKSHQWYSFPQWGAHHALDPPAYPREGQHLPRNLVQGWFPNWLIIHLLIEELLLNVYLCLILWWVWSHHSSSPPRVWEPLLPCCCQGFSQLRLSFCSGWLCRSPAHSVTEGKMIIAWILIYINFILSGLRASSRRVMLSSALWLCYAGRAVEMIKGTFSQGLLAYCVGDE